MATTIARASLLLGVDGANLNSGLTKSSNDVKTWGKGVKATTQEAGRDFAEKIKLPELPKPKDFEFEVRAKLIREEEPLRKVAKAANKAGCQCEPAPIERVMPQVRGRDSSPQRQTQTTPPTQSKGLFQSLLELVGLATVAKKVAATFVELSSAGHAATVALAKVEPTRPVAEPRKLAIPPGLADRFAPTAPLATKGQPIPSRLNLPVPMAGLASHAERVMASDVLPRRPMPVVAESPLPRPTTQFPPTISAPKKYKKGTADKPLPGEKADDKDLPQPQPKGPPRKTTLPVPPRNAKGGFVPYYVMPDPPDFGTPKPPKIPLAKFAPEQFGVKAAGPMPPRRIDIPLARQAREDRLAPGVPEARRALPSLQSPTIDLARLRMPTLPTPSVKLPTPPRAMGAIAPPVTPGGTPEAAASGLGAIAPIAVKIAIPLAVIAAGIFAAKRLADAFGEVAEKARAASAEARGLGVGLAGFQQLGYAARVAGVSADTLSAGLAHMQSVLKASDAESGRVFGQLGLSVDELKKLPIDEALAKVAGGLRSIKDPTAQARAGLEIFGDSFTRLQPLLNKGPEGLAALAMEAKRLGISFGEADASKLIAANEALTRLGSGFDGLRNQLAILAAPAIEVIAGKLVEWKDKLVSISAAWTQVGEDGTSALGRLGTGLATAWDGLQATQGILDKYISAPILSMVATVTDIVVNLSAPFIEFADDVMTVVSGPLADAWESIKSGVQDVVDAFTFAWDVVVDVFTDAWTDIKATSAKVYDWLGQPIRDAIDAVVGWFSWLRDKIADAWNAIRSIFQKTKAGDAVRDVADALSEAGQGKIDNFGKSAGAFDDAMSNLEKKANDTKAKLGQINPLDELRANILKGITGLEAELRDSMQKVGLTGAEGKIFDLRKQGATDADLAKVKEMADLAKSVDIAFANVRMPDLEVFDRSITGLDELLKNGRINMQQYQRGVLEASGKLESATGTKGPMKTVSGEVANSKEALTSIIKGEMADKSNDPQAQLLRAQMEAREIAKKQLLAAEKLIAVIEDRKDEDGGGAF